MGGSLVEFQTEDLREVQKLTIDFSSTAFRHPVEATYTIQTCRIVEEQTRKLAKRMEPLKVTPTEKVAPKAADKGTTRTDNPRLKKEESANRPQLTSGIVSLLSHLKLEFAHETNHCL